MRRGSVVLVLVVVLSWSVAGSSCGFTDPESKVTYDLSSLTYDPSQPSPPGYDGKDLTEQTYFINFCQEVSTVDPDTAPCNAKSPSGVCQISGGTPHNAGQVSTETFSSNWNDDNAPQPGNFTSGISLTYSHGELCTGSSYYRTTTIMVACNPDVAVGGVYGAYDDRMCSYTVYFSSKYACAPKPPPPEPTLVYEANNISLQQQERMAIISDDGWDENYIAFLQVNSGHAALGYPIGNSRRHPVHWFCANSTAATTMTILAEPLIVGCMQGPCDVNVKIGTPAVGRCFQYNTTAMATAEQIRYRGDEERCHWDSLCFNPIGGPLL